MTGFEESVVPVGWAGITRGLLFSNETARALVITSVPIVDAELGLVVIAELAWTLVAVFRYARCCTVRLCRRNDSVAGDWAIWAGRWVGAYTGIRSSCRMESLSQRVMSD